MEENKKEKLFILIFCLCAVLIPTTAGLVLTIIFRRIVYLESIYAIFGVLITLIALLRSRRRDSKNYHDNKSVHEDHDTDSYRSYRRLQMTYYFVGLGLLLASLIAFLIGTYALHI